MTPRPVCDERTLVLRAQDGDVSAFEQLVERHQGRLFRLAYMILHNRMDAEDVVQDALLRSWRSLHLLNEPAAFHSWLSQLTVRTATDAVRKAARRATDLAEQERFDSGSSQEAVGASAGRNADQPERATLANVQMETLARILQSLEESQRTCWVLREIDGMSYREIAEVVGVTESTVRGRIARARLQIVDQMEEWR